VYFRIETPETVYCLCLFHRRGFQTTAGLAADSRQQEQLRGLPVQIVLDQLSILLFLPILSQWKFWKIVPFESGSEIAAGVGCAVRVAVEPGAPGMLTAASSTKASRIEACTRGL